MADVKEFRVNIKKKKLSVTNFDYSEQSYRIEDVNGQQLRSCSLVKGCTIAASPFEIQVNRVSLSNYFE